MYYNGEQIPRDINKAIHYLTLASNNNVTKAQKYLGEIYSGRDVPIDIEKTI